MYQKRHYGSSGPKPNNLFNQTDQSKSNNSYTQLHFENSLGKVQVCYDLLCVNINLKILNRLDSGQSLSWTSF